MTQPSFSNFAAGVTTETAFDVLSIAKQLKAAGKRVIELEIGDSPFPSTQNGVDAGIKAIQDDMCHYGPSNGIPEFRQAVADYVNSEYGLSVGPENVVAGPGAKIFEQLFCEAFINEGDGVLVFSPFSRQFGLRFAPKIDGDLLEYGVKFAQNMAPNGLRENRELQISMSVSNTDHCSFFPS